VFADPRHPYTRALLRSVIALDAPGREPEPIPGAPPEAGAPPSGCRFHPRCAFRHDICNAGEYPLLAIGEARASACAFHEELPHGL
jgi:oligopeptide/dipeptide ABC transporter ATP-binding protein